jgi:hypothetical protein
MFGSKTRSKVISDLNPRAKPFVPSLVTMKDEYGILSSLEADVSPTVHVVPAKPVDHEAPPSDQLREAIRLTKARPLMNYNPLPTYKQYKLPPVCVMLVKQLEHLISQAPTVAMICQLSALMSAYSNGRINAINARQMTCNIIRHANDTARSPFDLEAVFVALTMMVYFHDNQ